MSESIVFVKWKPKNFPSPLKNPLVSFGESPLTVKVFRKGGILEKIFGRKIKGLGMMGGKSAESS